MGFLERAIRRGVSDAVGKAVGNAEEQTLKLTNMRLATIVFLLILQVII